jgi:4-amino-4-deoxychorismate lyase
MSLLFETICVKNGIPQQMQWHERRMNLSRQEIWQICEPIVLKSVLVVPDLYSTDTVRCNIQYGPEIEQISFNKYEKRIICSLRLVNVTGIDYHLKYTDRSLLESLFKLRGSCDEVLIVKDGFLTDTSMSNLMFFDGKSWFTPATPLLRGTCRDRLVAEGWLFEKDIRVEELIAFTGCKIINAMRDPDEERLIPVSEIS